MWKILIPVDGSDNSLRAVQYAADSLSRDPQQEFVLVNVQEPFPLRARAALHEDEMRRILEEDGEEALRSARAIMERAGARYQARTVCGRIGEAIAREVEETGCNAIVMGTRGMSAAVNMMVGSVATRVVHAVRVPVTLVK